MMTVTTKGGAVYSIDYRDLAEGGKRLSILRRGGPDDPAETNAPMVQDTWYRVALLTPLPPQIGTRVQMVLDPVVGDDDPVVRTSSLVMSVVGTL
jgi:hypothetical protein